MNMNMEMLYAFNDVIKQLFWYVFFNQEPFVFAILLTLHYSFKIMERRQRHRRREQEEVEYLESKREEVRQAIIKIDLLREEDWVFYKFPTKHIDKRPLLRNLKLRKEFEEHISSFSPEKKALLKTRIRGYFYACMKDYNMKCKKKSKVVVKETPKVISFNERVIKEQRDLVNSFNERVKREHRAKVLKRNQIVLYKNFHEELLRELYFKWKTVELGLKKMMMDEEYLQNHTDTLSRKLLILFYQAKVWVDINGSGRESKLPVVRVKDEVWQLVDKQKAKRRRRIKRAKRNLTKTFWAFTLMRMMKDIEKNRVYLTLDEVLERIGHVKTKRTRSNSFDCKFVIPKVIKTFKRSQKQKVM